MQKEMRAARKEVERMGLSLGHSSSLGRVARKRWQEQGEDEYTSKKE